MFPGEGPLGSSNLQYRCLRATDWLTFSTWCVTAFLTLVSTPVSNTPCSGHAQSCRRLQNNPWLRTSDDGGVDSDLGWDCLLGGSSLLPWWVAWVPMSSFMSSSPAGWLDLSPVIASSLPLLGTSEGTEAELSHSAVAAARSPFSPFSLEKKYF